MLGPEFFTLVALSKVYLLTQHLTVYEPTQRFGAPRGHECPGQQAPRRALTCIVCPESSPV